jgi:hypothetical protein
VRGIVGRDILREAFRQPYWHKAKWHAALEIFAKLLDQGKDVEPDSVRDRRISALFAAYIKRRRIINRFM